MSSKPWEETLKQIFNPFSRPLPRKEKKLAAAEVGTFFVYVYSVPTKNPIKLKTVCLFVDTKLQGPPLGMVYDRNILKTSTIFLALASGQMEYEKKRGIFHFPLCWS